MLFENVCRVFSRRGAVDKPLRENSRLLYERKEALQNCIEGISPDALYHTVIDRVRSSIVSFFKDE